jgi:hypothetical protein
MYFQTLSYSRIVKILSETNEYLVRRGITGKIIVTGGSAIALLSKGSRVTTDIDYIGNLALSSAELNKLSLSNDVEGILIVPAIEEMTFDEQFKYSNLEVYVLSWEDLAIMKLYSTRQKDLEDLQEYILPNIKLFHQLNRRLKYYECDYVGNLNDPDLNYNSYDRLVQGLKSSHKIVICERGIALEKALKSARMFSKFKAYPHKHLDLELLLSTPIEQCLQVFGFKEYLQKITGYDFRI